MLFLIKIFLSIEIHFNRFVIYTLSLQFTVILCTLEKAKVVIYYFHMNIYLTIICQGIDTYQ